MKTILTPVDFSDVSEAVVKQAAELARALEARIILLAVVQPPIITSEYAPLMAENLSQITAVGEKNAARQLTHFRTQLSAQGIESKSVQLFGSPILIIAEQAAKFEADYIVMGSHGHNALYDLIVGSTTHGVLLRAKCPVMIVPAPKQKSEGKRAASRAAKARAR